MTEQTITIEKIEHRPGTRRYPWLVTARGYGGCMPMTDEEFAATGLTPPEPTIPITIGEQTATVSLSDAKKYVALWRCQTDKTNPYHRVAVAFAAALSAHLEAEQ